MRLLYLVTARFTIVHIPEKGAGTWEPRSHTLEPISQKGSKKCLSNLSFGARFPASSSNFLRYEELNKILWFSIFKVDSMWGIGWANFITRVEPDIRHRNIEFSGSALENLSLETPAGSDLESRMKRPQKSVHMIFFHYRI